MHNRPKIWCTRPEHEVSSFLGGPKLAQINRLPQRARTTLVVEQPSVAQIRWVPWKLINPFEDHVDLDQLWKHVVLSQQHRLQDPRSTLARS